MSSLEQFKQAFRGAGVRPNQFKVQLNFPTVAGGADVAALSEFMCSAATLPESQLGTIETFFRGRAVKTPGDRTFDAWTVTIINDTDFKLRNALENWSEYMNSNSTNLSYLTTSSVWRDLTVTQLDRVGNEVKTYKMIGAWPKTVSAIDLRFDDTNSIETYTVQFEYQYWATEGAYASRVTDSVATRDPIDAIVSASGI